MSHDRRAWFMEKLIPSERGAGNLIIAEVLQQLEKNRWTQRDIYSVHLALEEAIVNAIKHGNRQDHSKQVRVVCKMTQHKLRVEITDEGKGFDPDTVPDPTDPDRLDVPSGRGIMLMRCYMNRVEYNDQGNIVVMEKERAAQ